MGVADLVAHLKGVGTDVGARLGRVPEGVVDTISDAALKGQKRLPSQRTFGGDTAKGLIDGNPGQVLTQAIGVGSTMLYTAVVSFILLKAIDMVMGLRVTPEEEREGLDLALHGETVH